MEKIKAWVESHPYISGIVVIVAGIAVLLVMRSGGTSNASVSSAGTSTSTNQYDAQIAAINASTQAASDQASAQIAATQIAANAQTSTAQLQLSALQDQDASAVKVAQVTTQGQTDQLAGQESMYESIYNNFINAGVTEQQSNDNVLNNANDNQASIVEATLQQIKSLGTNRATQAINELGIVEGQGSVGTYNQSQATEAIASAYESASIIGSLSSLGGKIAGGLL